VNPTSSVAIISSASASCGVVTATRIAQTAAMRKTARRLPRDLHAVTTSFLATATNSVSRRAITATWSATAWTAATKLDAVSIDEYFTSRPQDINISAPDFISDKLNDR